LYKCDILLVKNRYFKDDGKLIYDGALQSGELTLKFSRKFISVAPYDTSIRNTRNNTRD
jgi:hypothetical protein